VDRDILAVGRNMVWNIVYYDFKAGFVAALKELFELLHPALRLICQIRIYIVIIYNRVGGADISFNIGFACGMTDNSGIPNGINAKRA
jgi:hypothetical protein